MAFEPDQRGRTAASSCRPEADDSRRSDASADGLMEVAAGLAGVLPSVCRGQVSRRYHRSSRRALQGCMRAVMFVKLGCLHRYSAAQGWSSRTAYVWQLRVRDARPRSERVLARWRSPTSKGPALEVSTCAVELPTGAFSSKNANGRRWVRAVVHQSIGRSQLRHASLQVVDTLRGRLDGARPSHRSHTYIWHLGAWVCAATGIC